MMETTKKIMTDRYKNRLFANDVAVGDKGPELIVEDVDIEDFVRYAGASGDFNPIHYDESAARESGSETVFGQGMLVAGYVSHMVTDWFGLDRIDSFSVRFKNRLSPGDTVIISGEITECTDAGPCTKITAETSATNQSDITLVSGSVKATVPNQDDKAAEENK
jgi:acyl dehydratase